MSVVASVRGLPIRGLLTVFAGFIINLILGAFYTFGNIMPYMASYMRNGTDANVTYSDFATVNMFFGCFNGISLAGAPLFLIPYIGHRLTIVLGTLFYAGGSLLTRYALDHSLGSVMVTYGVMEGLANMVLIPTYVVPLM